MAGISSPRSLMLCLPLVVHLSHLSHPSSLSPTINLRFQPLGYLRLLFLRPCYKPLGRALPTMKEFRIEKGAVVSVKTRMIVEGIVGQ